MAVIDKKLIHFKNWNTFISSTGVNGDYTTPSSGTEDGGNAIYGQIKGTSIVFIKDVGKIWTHGKVYNNVNWSYLRGYGAGEIAYVDSNENIKLIEPSKWNSTLGSPVGVVVVPGWFAPDGKTRIVSLFPVDESGNASTSKVEMQWGTFRPDTSNDYANVIIGQDVEETVDIYGDLPSDNFSGTVSIVDPMAYYIDTSQVSPSPYKGDSYNPLYFKNYEKYGRGQNALSNFEGKADTQFIIDADPGTKTVIAPKAAWLYKDSLTDLQWYLPSLGELGFLVTRLKRINQSISLLGGVPISGSVWSSTWYSLGYSATFANMNTGRVGGDNVSNYETRPFTTID